MDPITSSLIMGGASLGSGALGFFGQQQTNAMNERMMQKAETWEEQMSSTAHQREVADLKAAGLNPILSAGGSGASSPGITAPSMTSPLQAASSSAMGAVRAGIDMYTAAASAEKAHASAKLDEANAAVARKTASEKGPRAAFSEDMSSVYNVLHDKIATFLQRQGINQSNASKRNWFFGSPDVEKQDINLTFPGGGR